MGVAQDCKYYIKQKKMKEAILKVDLPKAYDKIDWYFLTFVLIQMGLPVDVVAWIMDCIAIANFAVIINDRTIDSFRGSRGL